MNERILLILLSNFFVINCYSYQSTEEAILLYDHALCMGDCTHHDGVLKCVYDWEAHEAECKPIKVKTKKYKTITGQACYSNCGKYGEKYDWCATNIDGNLSWHKCTKVQEMRAKSTVQTNNQYLTCSDECSKRSSDKFWCNTVLGWQYCDPKNKVILFSRHTVYNVMCASPCALSNNEPNCYDIEGKFNRCFLTPDKDEDMSKLSKYLESNWNHGKYTQNGYELCKKVKTTQLEFPNPADVESLARHYESEYSTVVMRTVDSKNVVTDNLDPTTQYTVIDTVNRFNEDQLVLPLVYRGIVTKYTLHRSEKDSDWSAEIRNNYNRMDPILDGNNQDDRGYLLASRLGGPTERFNIFPQYVRYNGGNFSRWYYLETDILDFIDRHAGGYAEYAAVLSYDLTTATPYRPTAIGLTVKLRNRHNVLCDKNGDPLGNQVNVLANMFFANDPKSSCII